MRKFFFTKNLLLLCLLSLYGCVMEVPSKKKETQVVVDNYLRLARGYLNEGLVIKALKPVRRALELEPRSAGAYGVLAMTYQMQGENELALQSFQQALKYDSKASEIRNNYGAFLVQQGLYQKAYDEFALAAADVNYSNRDRAFENMAIVSKRMGKINIAVQSFERALVLNNNLPRSLFGLAEIHYELREYSKSGQYYKQFLEFSKQTAVSLYLGIQISRQLNNQATEKRYVEQLRRLYPYSEEWRRYQSSQ